MTSLLLVLALSVPGDAESDSRVRAALAAAELPTVEAPPAKEAEPAHNYRWKPVSTEQIALYDGESQIGNYWYESGLYYRLGKGFDGKDKWIEAPLPHGVKKPPYSNPPPKAGGTGKPPAMPIPSQSSAPRVRVRSC